MKPKPNSLWKYVGPEPGTNQIHRVVYSTPTEIITIGLPMGHGCSWLGTGEDFGKVFKFAANE